jgi:NAD+ synthase (glutamine-hydrolysing)
MSDWTDFLDLYRETTAFNAEEWVKNKSILFDKYLEDNRLSGAVVSVSGGIDSAVTLALMKYTMELPNSHLKKIVALSQPIHSSVWALNRAVELCNSLEVSLTVIDQTKIHQQIVDIFENNMGTQSDDFSRGQLRSYLRTPANYFAAQILRKDGFPAIVIGTGNKDEDGYLAYFCKYGDGAVDLQLISDLHKSQVFKVGAFLQIPESILQAAPSADLWDGQTDEEEMGFSYDFIEFYIGYYLLLDENNKNNLVNNLSDKSREDFLKFQELCTCIHKRNTHKLKGVINL